MSPLPNGWAEVQLDAVASIRPGRTPRRLDDYLKANPRTDRDVPFFKVGDMTGDSARFMSSARTHLAFDELRLLGVEPVPSGTIVFPKAGGAIATNKKRTIHTPGAIDLNCMAVVPGPRVESDYLYYWFEALDLRTLADGSILPQISKRRVTGLVIPLPPLDEQRRIVDILEDHLSRLDAADALLSVNLVRTTTLGSLACEAALRHAAEESGGAWRSMGEVCEFVTDGDHNPPKRVQTGVPHVTAKGIHDGIIDLAGCTFIDESGFEKTSKRYRPQAGDVLITCVGTIGRVAVVPPGITFSADRNLAGLRPRARLVEPEYLALAANSVTLQHAMKRASGSTAQPHLYLRDIRALQVPTPVLEVQQQLIRRADEQRVSRGRMRSALELAVRRSAKLRRSILQAAFSGRLTGQSSDVDRVEELAGV